MIKKKFNIIFTEDGTSLDDWFYELSKFNK